MAKQLGSDTTQTLKIIIPSRGERDWDQDIENLCFLPISTHDHTGNGNGHRIGTAALDDASVTEVKIANAAVTEDKIQNGAVTRNKIANDAINGDKIANDSINSEHYVDGSIDNIHLSDDSVDGRVIADDSIDSNHYVNSSIDSIHIAPGAVYGSNIANLTITGAKIQSGSITGDKVSSALAGAGLSKGTSSESYALKVNVDDSTIEIDSDTLQVKAGGITSNELSASVNTAINNADTTSSSNSTAITNLTNRVTTLEGGTGAAYTLGNNANNDLPSYLSNADVLIDYPGTVTVSNKEFENVRFSLDCNTTFQNCTLRNCFFGEGDNSAIPWSLTFTDCNSYASEIFSMNTVTIKNSNFYRGSIQANTLTVDNISATSIKTFEKSVVNVTGTSYVKGNSTYQTFFKSNDVTTTDMTFYSYTDDSIVIQNGRIDTLTIGSDAYYLDCITATYSPNIIVHESSSLPTTFKLRAGTSDIINNVSAYLVAFKIINGVYSVYDKGLVPSGTPSNGDTLVYNSTSGEWEPGAPSSGSSSVGSTEVLIAAILGYPNVQPNTWTDAIRTSTSNPGYFVKYESLGNFLDGTSGYDITVPAAHNNSVYLLSIHASFYNSGDFNEIRVLLDGNVIYSTNNGSAARHIGIPEFVFTVTTGQVIKIQLRHNGGIAITPDGTYCLKRIIE